MDEEMGDLDCDPNVGFLYKTMLHRDPRKRRVKPVQSHLMQINFGGLDDSSDDSDFQVPNGIDSGNSDDSDEDLGGRSKESDLDGEDDESEGSSSSEGHSEDGEEAGEEEEEQLTVGELIERAKSRQKAPSEETGTSTASSKKLKVVICCVCLGDISEEEDEIVECDGCGVSVHEGCYGIGELQSVASTESSASTEPWFCDACKAGVKPHCQLCPNSGGIFKETDAGKWVHIVCALYIPGVAFGDVDRLSPVTLFEMPYSKWGAKECCLCEDGRFSRTGVCIGCDAGMCRSFFHVSCAQREGLLSEASPDEDIADPFFAYCKQHADKLMVRAKRRNWLAIQSNMKQHSDQDNMDEKEKLRVQRKLDRHRQKHIIACSKRLPTWIPTEKMPRMLLTSPSAVRRLMKKAELLGISTTVQNTSSQKDIRKKWHVAPALSVDFVSYYLDRSERMKTMTSQLRELLSQREKLQEQEHLTRLKYDQTLSDVGQLKDANEQKRQAGEKLWNIINKWAQKPKKVPDVITMRKLMRSPTRRDTPRSPPAVIHQCGLCHMTHDQHLLAKCDTCRLYYHLGCLDPPLSRMPKKTKLQGWQCSECASSGSDDSDDPDVDTNAPRRLRETIKEPQKFTPPTLFMSKKKAEGKKRKRSSMLKTMPTKRKVEVKEELPETDDKPQQKALQTKKEQECVEDLVNVESKPLIKSNKTPEAAPKVKASPVCKVKVKEEVKVKDIGNKCVTCGNEGNSTNLVRCDGCKQSYHFSCLEPPTRKSPKVRGYNWYCTACDSEESDEDMDVDSVDLKPEIREKRIRKPSSLLQQDDLELPMLISKQHKQAASGVAKKHKPVSLTDQGHSGIPSKMPLKAGVLQKCTVSISDDEKCLGISSTGRLNLKISRQLKSHQHRSPEQKSPSMKSVAKTGESMEAAKPKLDSDRQGKTTCVDPSPSGRTSDPNDSSSKTATKEDTVAAPSDVGDTSEDASLVVRRDGPKQTLVGRTYSRSVSPKGKP